MLTNQALYEIKGGIGKWTVVTIAGSIITFIIGVIDGYMRPLKCNK